MKTRRKILLFVTIVGTAAVFGVFIVTFLKIKEIRAKGDHHKTAALLQSLSQALKAYDTEYELPFDHDRLSSNSKILRTLTGDNPRKMHFTEFSPQNIDPEGLQIIDSWGTPIHFTVNSDTLPTIRSLGSDRTLHTADDLVADEPGLITNPTPSPQVD